MKSNHTPGPWTFRDCTPEETNNKYEGLRFMVSDKYEIICRTTDGAKQAEVNAMLISASPELLNACQALALSCESLMAEVVGKGVTDWGLVNDALIESAKAIQKATGE